MSKDFFPLRPEINPTIYAYELEDVVSHKGRIKVGYTGRDVRKRIAEQLQTSGIKYEILVEESAMKKDGGSFFDSDVHRVLKKKVLQIPKENGLSVV